MTEKKDPKERMEELEDEMETLISETRTLKEELRSLEERETDIRVRISESTKNMNRLSTKAQLTRTKNPVIWKRKKASSTILRGSFKS